ncbi:MFS transporter [Flexivirga sp. ID2601S]|uniref:MFS transporter n=1 Tax=Flexivirga aerilata TaxID=1656889 RepID=A0A849AFT9_9MICO|nr:MFS transporter [Flexivirga aerilata]NNG38446.1 MFS transporter [Flexivirga aerilata]
MNTERATRWSASQVLAVPNFRAFLTVYVLDVAADALWLVTLGWVASGAHSSVYTGLVLAAGSIPHVLFLFHGGLSADRVGAGKVLRRTMPLRMALFLLWAAVATSVIGAWRLVVVLAVTFAIGAVAGYHDPALQKYPTEFLPRSGRGTAIKIERVSSRFAQAAGAFAGGWLLGHGGVSAASLAAGAALLVTLAILGRLARTPEKEIVVADADDSSVREGLDYVKKHPILRWTITTQGVVNLISAAAVMAILPLKARHAGWDAGAYGGSFGAYGIGITLGTAMTLRLTNISTRGGLLIGVGGATLSSAAVIGIGLATSQALTIGCAFVMGLTIGPVAPMLSGFAREDVPESLTGRVFSVISVATGGIEPVGSLITGLVAAALGINHTAEVLGAIATAACLGCFIAVWRNSRGVVLRA